MKSNWIFSELWLLLYTYIYIYIYDYDYDYDYDFNLDLLGLGLSINFPKLLKNPFKIELQLDKLSKYSRGVKTYRKFIIYNIIVIIELQLLQASTALREREKKKKVSHARI